MSRSSSERLEHRRLVGEERAGVVDGHAQHVGDVLVAPGDLERLVVVARAVAGRAGRVDARHEEQLDADEAFALAGLAAPLGDVEREAAGVVAARARRRRRREDLAHAVEQARVGGEVRARCPADRLLVDAHQPLDALHAGAETAARLLGDGRLVARRLVVVVRRLVAEVAADELDQRLADQARLARAGDADHRGQHAERKAGVEVLQVVAGDAAQLEPAAAARAARARAARAAANR